MPCQNVWFLLHFIFCLPLVIQKTGSPGSLDLISKVSSFDRSTAGQVTSCIIHNISIPLSMQGIFNACLLRGNQSVNWKSTQTERESLDLCMKHYFFVSKEQYNPCVRIYVRVRLFRQISNGEIDHASRYYSRCRNVNISTCRPLACRTWLRHCWQFPLLMTSFPGYPVQKKPPFPKTFAVPFSSRGGIKDAQRSVR